MCPLGYKTSLDVNFSINIFASQDTACVECPPGTYGNDPYRSKCDTCTPGYICQGKTITPTPTNTSDYGYICPAGHYCEAGALEPTACDPGTYRATTGGSSKSDCLQCDAGFYQNEPGKDTCYICSSSSSSNIGSTECTCVGKNRAFQPIDKKCICLPGYEFVDSNLVVSSDTDGIYDCQPIVYSICSASEIRDFSGKCVDSTTYCNSMCQNGGTISIATGTCQCNNISSLNEICDENCRKEVPYLACGDSGEIVLKNPVTLLSTPVDPSTLGTFNTIDCSFKDTKIVSLSTSSGSFSGLFGVPDTFTGRRRRLLPDSRQANNLKHSRHFSLLNTSNPTPELKNPLVCLKLGDSIVQFYLIYFLFLKF